MILRAYRLSLSLVLLLAAGDVAKACSCFGPQPVCSAYFGTPVIFRGTVLEMTLERSSLQTIRNLDGTISQVVRPGIYKVRVAVSESFRGVEGRHELTVYTNEQSSACGFPFEVGMEYVVFTYQNKGEDQLWTSKCSNTHALQHDSSHDSDLEWMRSLAGAPPGGMIFGHVRLARSGPMRGAKLSLRGAVDRDITPEDTGAYESKGLPAGEYKITATVPSGFTSGPEQTITLHDKGCAEVDWHVSYDGHVRGRVADVDGTPVGHLMVELQRRDANSFNGLAMVDMQETGEAGRYDFSRISPGDYIIVANNLGASPTRPYPRIYYPASESIEGASTVRVAASATVDDVDLVMPRAWKRVAVTTKVVNEDGTPKSGVTVYGYEVNNRSAVEPMSAVTGQDGWATLAVYEGQEYYVTASVQSGLQQRCGGPLRFTAQDGLNVGVVKIEHPWGNCLAQLNPGFRR